MLRQNLAVVCIGRPAGLSITSTLVVLVEDLEVARDLRFDRGRPPQQDGLAGAHRRRRPQPLARRRRRSASPMIDWMRVRDSRPIRRLRKWSSRQPSHSGGTTMSQLDDLAGRRGLWSRPARSSDLALGRAAAAISFASSTPARRFQQQEGGRGLDLVDAADVADQEVERAGPPGERLVDRGGAREARLVACRRGRPVPCAGRAARPPSRSHSRMPLLRSISSTVSTLARPSLIERAAQRRQRPVPGRRLVGSTALSGRAPSAAPARVFTVRPPRAVTTARSRSSIRNGLRSR